MAWLLRSARPLVEFELAVKSLCPARLSRDQVDDLRVTTDFFPSHKEGGVFIATETTDRHVCALKSIELAERALFH